MTPSENCLALIRAHEGLRLKAYRCPANVLTIGYGHTGPDVKPGSICLQSYAEAMLRTDAQTAGDVLREFWINNRLTQNQFDALTSFVFNVGEGSWRKSTMRRLLLDGLYAQAAEEFPRWVFGGGRRLPGLVVRRLDERELFLRV